MTRLVVVAAASIGLILLVAFITSRLVLSRRRGLSIRMQVFIALAAVMGAFAFGLGLMVLDRIESRAKRFALDSADEKARVIASLLGAELTSHPQADLIALSQHLTPNGDGHTLDDVVLLDEARRPLLRGAGLTQAESRASPSVHVEAPIEHAGRVVGHVQVVKTTIELERLLKDFAPTVLVISLLLGAVAALAAAWIGRAIAGPIESLTRFASEVSAGGGRALPAPATTGREVMRLTHSIDSMRRQLEGRPFVETFAADLSHELKNPVAAIRAAAEVLDESALEEPEEARRFVRRIREAVARIERLLGELLSLARIEARGVEGFPIVDLTELVRGAARTLDAKSRVAAEIAEGVRVRGDAAWLTRAVSNLLDNGLLHSTGEVRLALTLKDQEATLTVTSLGTIAPHTRSRLFGRFVTTRADKGGTGLGLAIVRAVAEAHRGQVRLLAAGPPEVHFALSLPAV
jgi:two-component system, OmpR family, sensor histidine kinase CreC